MGCAWRSTGGAPAIAWGNPDRRTRGPEERRNKNQWVALPCVETTTAGDATGRNCPVWV